MIFTLIIVGLIDMIETILSVFPELPDTPASIESGGQWAIDSIGGVIAILNWIFTPALLSACVIVIIALLNYEFIYRAIMWVIKKIPVLGIK